MDHDKEKKFLHDNSASDVTPRYDNDLEEPPKEDSLHRGLKARQISMIAVCISVRIALKFEYSHPLQLGGAVGTGLIIGSGTALRRGGPLGTSFFRSEL